MKLYQFAAIYNPDVKSKSNPEKAKVIVDITTILAKDERQAQLLAARAIPEEYTDRLDSVEIAVRPF